MTNDTSTLNVPLNVLVFGAGAIGTYIGGSLLLAGSQVVFIEQPAVAERLRTSRLKLNLDAREFQIAHPVVADDLRQALTDYPFDLALFALKSFDTQAVLDSCAPFKEQMPPILCLQNGIENEARIAAALGADKVIPGTVTSAVGRRGLGDIILERKRGLGISANHPLAKRVARTFTLAGLNALLYPDPDSMKWSKMLTNLLCNASSAILDRTPGEILADPRLYRLEIEQLREALAVMQAAHIPVTDLPGTPVRALAFAVRSIPTALSQPFLRKAVGGGRGGKMPSFHIDLYSGRGKTEVDYLNGAVVRFGAQYGVPTQVNSHLNTILMQLAGGETPLDSYSHQPEKLLDQVNP